MAHFVNSIARLTYSARSDFALVELLDRCEQTIKANLAKGDHGRNGSPAIRGGRWVRVSAVESSNNALRGIIADVNQILLERGV